MTAPPRRLATLLATLRPPFLLLTPACMAPLLALALHQGQATELADRAALALTLAGGLAAHASVNVLNEWQDWRSGLDLRTRRTPFSGGSGALPADPQAAPAALALGLLLLALAAACGLALLLRGVARLWPLLPIGLAGLGLVAAYTPWVTRRPWWCLAAPGLGFGPLMGLGTWVAVGGTGLAGALVLVAVTGLLTSALLLINQFPDVDADRSVGRRNLPLQWGLPRAAALYAALLAAALAALAAGVLAGALPAGAACGLLAAPLALQAAIGARRAARRPADAMTPSLLPAMRSQVLLSLGLPLLTAIGLALS
ncbi:MAG: prenyltransferase [Proteobacteria bacterium]|nr:prenyltransferase [Pseudomonadota bacterium]